MEVYKVESKVEAKKLIMLFIVVTYGISAIGDFIWISSGSLVHPAASLTILAPTIGAVAIYFKSEKKIKFNLSKCSIKEILICIAIPIIYFLMAYVTYILMIGKGNTFEPDIKDIFILIIQFIFMGILEEVGWRGILLPLMQRAYSYKKAIIFNALVWAFWHYPMIIGGVVLPYAASVHGIIIFTIEVILITMVIGNLQKTLRMISIWPIIFLHVTHNIISEIIIDKVGIENGIYIGDSGYIVVFFLAACTILLVCRYYKSKKDRGTLV